MQEESCNILCKTLANSLLGIQNFNRATSWVAEGSFGIVMVSSTPIFTFLSLVTGVWHVIRMEPSVCVS